jgi:aspartokinase
MARIVQKYGGTSVGDVERIKKSPSASKALATKATRSSSSSPLALA